MKLNLKEDVEYAISTIGKYIKNVTYIYMSHVSQIIIIDNRKSDIGSYQRFMYAPVNINSNLNVLNFVD